MYHRRRRFNPCGNETDVSDIPASAVPIRPLPEPPGPRPAPAAPPLMAGPRALRPTRSAAQRRHRTILISFLLVVLLPLLLSGSYLFAVAADQYASRAGFVVRKSDKSSGPAFELLGGITSLTSAGSTDATILYEYIQSQRMIELVDGSLDLRRIYGKPALDPVFAFDPEGSIEDLERYWSRMVRPHFDSATGLVEIRVLAFAPEDATAIAREIIRQSSLKINDLSAVARDDATRYAREDLEAAVAFLKTARQTMAEFRNRTRIVDPKADVQVQMGLISTLQTQLAESMIELDTLRNSTRTEDPRIVQAEQRIAVIENRIDAERRKFGTVGDVSDEAFASVMGEYESLAVDQQFAEQAYVNALAIYDEALAEARRQTLYLATYIEPTRAETAQYPRRLVLFALIAVFLLMIWSIGSLVAYSIWDRR